MHDHACLIQDCRGRAYAPTGTGYLCKEHFINFLTWRRKKGPQMFSKYAGMSMEERNSVAEEWIKTVPIEK